MKILIIDDEEAVLKMYAEKLTQGDYTVKTSTDGQEGMDMALNDKPDIILLDIIMPKLNGLDVLRILKSKNETKDIPILLLTNLPEEASGEKAKKLGADGYLVKAQCEPAKLLDEINKIFKLKNSNINQ